MTDDVQARQASTDETEASEIFLRTRTCEFWKEGDLLRARFLLNAEMEYEDAVDILDKLYALFRGTRRPVLVDTRPLKSQSMAARMHLAGSSATRILTAVALLVDSPVSRVISNFMIRLRNPEQPMRMFTSVDTARTWLLTYPLVQVDPAVTDTYWPPREK